MGADHGAHGRGVPSRQARRRACALVIEPQAHDGARAHAVEPPALCRLDAGAHQAAGRRDRAATRRRWSRSSCASARTPSRASAPAIGILRLANALRARAAGGRLRPRARDRRALLHLGQLDPEEQPRSPAARHRHGRAGDSPQPTSVAPATSIEETTRNADPSHPRPAASAQARRHGRRLRRAADPGPRQGSRATPNGWRCCSTARRRAAPPGASRAGCAAPGCATARPPSRTSTTARRAGSTRRCSSSSPPAAGSPSTATCSSPGRAASASRGSSARSRRRPAATATPCTTRACRGCSPISSWPTATAASPRLFRTLTKADLLILDDWGPDRLTANQRRDLMEIVEDRYGARLDADHQPAAGRHLARGHRRADLRRRHPRSPRPQRLPPRARRAVDAQARGGRGRACVRQCGGDGSKTTTPPSQRREPRNDRRAQHPARPRGSTGTSRARRCVRLVAVTPRRARVPPVDYGDGLRRA